MKPTLRAIINDQELHGSTMTSIYGSANDNSTIKTFKQVGYAISIYFLLLTLAIYCVIKEVRVVSLKKICHITFNIKLYLFTSNIFRSLVEKWSCSWLSAWFVSTYACLQEHLRLNPKNWMVSL